MIDLIYLIFIFLSKYGLYRSYYIKVVLSYTLNIINNIINNNNIIANNEFTSIQLYTSSAICLLVS